MPGVLPPDVVGLEYGPWIFSGALGQYAVAGHSQTRNHVVCAPSSIDPQCVFVPQGRHEVLFLPVQAAL
eukprot:12777168-Alexandrium_andersonii.AAC.1